MKHITSYLADLAGFDVAAQGGAIPEWSHEQLAQIDRLSAPVCGALSACFEGLSQRMAQADRALHPDAAVRDAAKYLRQFVLPLMDARANVGEAVRARRFDLPEAANDEDGGDHAA